MQHQQLQQAERARLLWWQGLWGQGLALCRDLLAAAYMLGLSAMLGAVLRNAALAARHVTALQQSSTR